MRTIRKEKCANCKKQIWGIENIFHVITHKKFYLFGLFSTASKVSHFCDKVCLIDWLGKN